MSNNDRRTPNCGFIHAGARSGSTLEASLKADMIQQAEKCQCPTCVDTLKILNPTGVETTQKTAV